MVNTYLGVVHAMMMWIRRYALRMKDFEFCIYVRVCVYAICMYYNGLICEQVYIEITQSKGWYVVYYQFSYLPSLKLTVYMCALRVQKLTYWVFKSHYLIVLCKTSNADTRAVARSFPGRGEEGGTTFLFFQFFFYIYVCFVNEFIYFPTVFNYCRL